MIKLSSSMSEVIQKPPFEMYMEEILGNSDIENDALLSKIIDAELKYKPLDKLLAEKAKMGMLHQVAWVIRHRLGEEVDRDVRREHLAAAFRGHAQGLRRRANSAIQQAHDDYGMRQVESIRQEAREHLDIARAIRLDVSLEAPQTALESQVVQPQQKKGGFFRRFHIGKI